VADVGVDGDTLVIKLTVRDRLLGLRLHDFRISLGAVRGATPLAHARSAVPPLRMPGTGIPGAFAVGTFYPWRGRRPKTFAVVYGNGPGIAIDLDAADFDRIVLSLPDPNDLVVQLNR